LVYGLIIVSCNKSQAVNVELGIAALIILKKPDADSRKASRHFPDFTLWIKSIMLSGRDDN